MPVREGDIAWEEAREEATIAFARESMAAAESIE